MKLHSRKNLAEALLSLLIVIVGTYGIANAQNFERYKPKSIPQRADTPQLPAQPDKSAVGSDQVLVQRLDALIVLDRATKVDPKNSFEKANGISFDVADSESLIFSDEAQQILNSYIGQPITLRRLNELSRELILFYRENGQPVIDVVIPEQNITAGSVQLVVIESRIGEIAVRGTCRTNPCWLLNQAQCSQPGDLIFESALNEDLYWLNRSPFRKVKLDMAPGTQPGTTDLFFDVNEVRPIRGYVGYEDTGVRSLALERLIAGFIVGNIFGRDGTLSYQYTTDPRFVYLEAHSGSFNYEFNRDWAFLTYGSWSAVQPNLPAPLNQNGESWQAGAGLTRYLKRSSWHEESLVMGLDFKSTNNNLEFGGTNVQTSGAELFQLNVGYNYFHRFENNDYVRFQNDIYVGPGDGFSPLNESAAFQTIRANTDPTYWYYRGVLERLWSLPRCWELKASGTGQAASERLLFSEMLGFGGNDTIRGYDQRMVSGDAGWIANVELGPQPWNIDYRGEPGNLKVFTFGDLGQAFINQPVAGELNERFLASVGVGMRYSLSNRLTLRFDYGHAFTTVPGMVTQDRVHISLVSMFGPTPR